MNNILPKLINEFDANALINGARFVFVTPADTMPVLEEAAATAETVPPPATEVPKAPEVTKITTATQNAVDVVKAKEPAKTPIGATSASQIAEAVPAESSVPEKTAPPKVETMPVRDRSILARVLIWPYWFATKGATEWTMGGKMGRDLDKIGRQLGEIDEGIMGLANFPWGPIKLPYWVVSRTLGLAGTGVTRVLSLPGKLLPDADNPFPSEK
ncbi:hypothetical protein COV81_01165 [Candidatus Peregrinibacteria bacterium CG11_big_fil_rev_8_21_14_0_20_41_10]|nr:MAG: hypothetical protein COV81_01165 [Candidatus Peregrinibacteria bacterium CG11_big_fil_rev_8_21_14_0_20_41_10]